MGFFSVTVQDIKNKVMNNIIKSFGCRLNIFETEVIKNFITKNKMKNVSVLNTCAVTKEAEKKAK